MQDIVQSAVRYWSSGGIILVPIACVCFLIWFYFLRVNARVQQFLSVPDSLIEESLSRLRNRILQGDHISGIQKFMHESNNRFLNAVFPLPGGDAGPLPERIDRARSAESRIIERYTVLLKALVVSSPLLGLLGTVLGMITTFDALGAGMSGAAGVMASGISRALITTQFGLIVALPGIWIISVLERHAQNIDARFAELRTHCVSWLRINDAA